jgi:pimeloyl-ACP methyl ester carboxylesterase
VNFAHFAVWPPADSPVSAFSLAREMAALGQVSIAPPPFPQGAARGNGQSVIVIPGFFAPELSTERLREFLREQNFVPHSWAGGINLGPMPNMFQALDRQIDEIVDVTSRPVSIVGISLGGTIAREVAKRHPERVARVVTLLSPIKLPVVSPLAPLAQAAALLWDNGALDTLDALATPPPVPLTALVSPMDGIVDWRICVPEEEDADIVEIHGPHMTIGSNPDAMRVVADRLSRA